MSTIAVIATGGKQYLVKAGDTLRVEKLTAKEGEKLALDAMLVADDTGANAKVGTPTVAGAKVMATVGVNGRAKKVTIIKFHAKTRYKRKNGHRQEFTTIKIDEVKA